MGSNIISGTTKTAKGIAQQTARQIAQEPLEVLKTATKQITSTEAVTSDSPPYGVSRPTQVSQAEIQNLSDQDLQHSQSRYENLQREIQAIAKEKEEKERARKQSEEIEKKALTPISNPIIEPSTKRSRNPLRGMAKKISDLGKRAEIRMPPSG